MDARDSEPDEPIALWRWLRWYPLVLVALAGVLWLVWPDGVGGPTEVRTEPGGAEVLAPPPAAQPSAAEGSEPAPGDVEAAPAGPGLLERGRDRAAALEGAAKRVAGVFGLRFSEGVDDLREHVGPDELRSGGLKAARLTPFVGPYLRYQRARDLFASGEPELQEQARRQTVIALVELSLDVGAAGLGQVAAGSEGLLQAMEGVVEAADFADFALSLHGELGAPLGFAGLDALDSRVDELAGTALREIGGLEAFVDELLAVEPPDWLSDVPPELAAEARELLVELLEASGALR